MKCEDCGSEDGEECYCPYQEEINDTLVDSILCNACYQDRAWDV